MKFNPIRSHVTYLNPYDSDSYISMYCALSVPSNEIQNRFWERNNHVYCMMYCLTKENCSVSFI